MTLQELLDEWNSPCDTITVHTSGSTGKPKAIRVEKSRMRASAAKTCRFLSLRRGDTALLCMSLDYIAGKMMVVRSIVGGMKLISVTPSSHPLRGIASPPHFAAMVPMQVYSSMQDPEELDTLRHIRHLIIGGGAVDPGMARMLKSFPNAVWSTYGMTETLSHIALRRLSGDMASDYYTPFEGVALRQDDDGCLVVDAPDVCPATLHTNDIVEFHPDGVRFRIIGRKDNVIVSGGVKIHIEEVEQMLAPHLACDFAVSKRPDPRFGEVAVLVLANKGEKKRETDSVWKIISECLPRYWRPKEIIPVPAIPRTATGKIARAEVLSRIGQKQDTFQ